MAADVVALRDPRRDHPVAQILIVSLRHLIASREANRITVRRACESPFRIGKSRKCSSGSLCAQNLVSWYRGTFLWEIRLNHFWDRFVQEHLVQTQHLVGVWKGKANDRRSLPLGRLPKLSKKAAQQRAAVFRPNHCIHGQTSPRILKANSLLQIGAKDELVPCGYCVTQRGQLMRCGIIVGGLRRSAYPHRAPCWVVRLTDHAL